MKRLVVLLGLLGLAGATALIAYQGAGPILAALAGAGFGILWASLFHVVPMLFNAYAWQILLPRGRRPNTWFFLWAVWVRESVNGLLPVARIGGEIVTARMLIQAGRPVPVATASLVIDMTLSILSQFLFTVLGLVLLLRRGDGGSLVGEVLLGLGISIGLIALLFLVQRAGIFTVLVRVFRTFFGNKLESLTGGAAKFDRAIGRLYRRRAAVALCTWWQLVGWIAGAGEIWLALYFLGHPVSFEDALFLEAMVQAISSSAFVVPGSLGVQEAGFLVLGGMIGLPPETALALALARRARDLIVFVPGLAAWQIAVGRRYLGRSQASR